MWQNAEEFREALAGAYGQEEQAAAVQFADETGMLAQAEAEEDVEATGDYDDALEREFQRVEARIGRKLTADEEQAMLNNISTQDRGEGVVPDFVADYGQQLADTGNHEAGRVHLGAAAAERAFEQIGAEDRIGAPRPLDLEPANPWGGDVE